MSDEIERSDSMQGFSIEAGTGALLTLPWDESSASLPSLAPGLIRWCANNLVHGETGRPWEFTKDQRRFLHLWYAVDDDGRWRYTSGVFRRAKGCGKDPLAAAYLWGELLGPCRFDRFESVDGVTVAVGKPQPSPLVQIGANAESQAKDVLAIAGPMLSAHARHEYGVVVGILQVRATSNNGRLELLTSSMRAAEGDPATAIVLNESQHMTKESHGTELSKVARRNTGKSPGGLARVLELTNAHDPGRDSVAERSYDSWLKQASGQTLEESLLYDSREAPADTDLWSEASLQRGLAAAYADAPWIDLKRIVSEVRDTRTPESESKRFYLNVISAGEGVWADPAVIRAAARADRPLVDDDEIVLFGDGSKSGDASGIVAARISDGHCQVIAVQQPRNGETVDVGHFDHAVAQAFARFKVAAFYFDPSHAKDDNAIGDARYWFPSLDSWHRLYGAMIAKPLWATSDHSIAWDMSSGSRQSLFVPAVTEALDDLNAGTLTHDGSVLLVDHMTNAKLRTHAFGYTIGKATRSSSHKVDLAVCLIGARMLRRLVLNARVGVDVKPAKPPHDGRVFFA